MLLYKSLFLFLFYCSLLTVPRTELIGDSDRYVKAGSTVIFRCVVIGALEKPSYIMWYHGFQQIYVENRRGWKVQFDRDVEGDSQSSVSMMYTISHFHHFHRKESQRPKAVDSTRESAYSIEGAVVFFSQ